MSTIDRLGNSSPIQKILNQPVRRQVAADAPQQLPVVDKLELSGMGHMLKALQANDIRQDKVAAVKAQIEAGTYESDQKLNIAIDRMLEDLNH